MGLFVVLFVLLLYTFLHETGHALVGLSFGQTLSAFNVSFWDLSAHVRLSGSLAPNRRAVQSVAGVMLPFLLWLLFIMMVPRRASFPLESVKLIGSMAVVNSLLSWIILPILDLLGQAPTSDDVIHFLRASRIEPLLLTGAAVLLYGLGWRSFLARSDGIRHYVLLFRQGNVPSTSELQPTVFGMVAIMALLLSITVGVNVIAVQNQGAALAPPPDFQLVAEIDLSSRAYDADVLGQFMVAETAAVDIFFTLQEVDTPYLDLSLIGPAGDEITILHGEGFRTGRHGKGTWKRNLPAGTYQLVLTAHQSPGVLSVFRHSP